MQGSPGEELTLDRPVSNSAECKDQADARESVEESSDCRKLARGADKPIDKCGGRDQECAIKCRDAQFVKSGLTQDVFMKVIGSGTVAKEDEPERTEENGAWIARANDRREREPEHRAREHSERDRRGDFLDRDLTRVAGPHGDDREHGKQEGVSDGYHVAAYGCHWFGHG